MQMSIDKNGPGLAMPEIANEGIRNHFLSYIFSHILQ